MSFELECLGTKGMQTIIFHKALEICQLNYSAFKAAVLRASLICSALAVCWFGFPAQADSDSSFSGKSFEPASISPACLNGTYPTSISEGQSTFGDCLNFDERYVPLGLAAGQTNSNRTNQLWRQSSGFSNLEGNNLETDFYLPLFASGKAPNSLEPRNALYFQHGITSWNSHDQIRRNDFRYGLTHRIRTSDSTDSGLFGISVLVEQNIERGHQRFVSGLGYNGNWGSSTLRWFSPMKQGIQLSSAYEEQALEGVELSVNVNITSEVDFGLKLGQWEVNEADDQYRTLGGGVSLQWRPHSWVTFRYSLDRKANKDSDSSQFNLIFERPKQ